MRKGVAEEEQVNEATAVPGEVVRGRKVGVPPRDASHLEVFSGGTNQPPQRWDGWLAPAVLIRRDHRLGRAGAVGEFGLGQAVAHSCRPEQGRRVHAEEYIGLSMYDQPR